MWGLRVAGATQSHQSWDPKARDCQRVCDTNSVEIMLTKECEFCLPDFRCAPGFNWGSPRANCTHCVACQKHPENAIWSQQHDRFDCMMMMSFICSCRNKK
jgi:hypothetical protein